MIMKLKIIVIMRFLHVTLVLSGFVVRPCKQVQAASTHRYINDTLCHFVADCVRYKQKHTYTHTNVNPGYEGPCELTAQTTELSCGCPGEYREATQARHQQTRQTRQRWRDQTLRRVQCVCVRYKKCVCAPDRAVEGYTPCCVKRQLQVNHWLVFTESSSRLQNTLIMLSTLTFTSLYIFSYFSFIHWLFVKHLYFKVSSSYANRKAIRAQFCVDLQYKCKFNLQSFFIIYISQRTVFTLASIPPDCHCLISLTDTFYPK